MPFVGDEAHLEHILELIGHIARRLEDIDRANFIADRDEVDLTAYRLAAIGEATRNLSETLRSRYPGVPWRAIYDMRNIIAHDYGAIIPERVWNVTRGELDDLRQICLKELGRK